MTPAARCSAAIEVLTDIAERRRPAADALKDWGLAHRFAGSGDRAGIASLVYDALRRRASAAWIMGADTPRAVLIGTLRLQQGLAAGSVATLFTGERFAPAPLSDDAIVDLCAGGGGKTLALAAETGNGARLIATDGDPRRLAPIHERLRRSGALAEVRTPRSGKARADVLEDLDGKVDRVVVDAPCTGSGTWRRNPDAKWRLRPGSLALRTAEQAQVLDRAARLVRPGGRIVYITCSLLSAENDAAVAGLLSGWRGRFDVVPADEVLATGPDSLRSAVRKTAHGIQMSPLRTGTDGFYVAVIARKG
ncbi:RsmB/NOP family class I SAM-dependent RNA methyltransferase [Methylobacterium oryzae]|uniref:RsmB/NOP family class I SAM-dependent RNA methyltransferase n=1 Tax=Methylobacterium oryzae TaxID=334852 RepID=UPI002F347663